VGSATPLNISGGDDKRIADLHEHGKRTVGRLVVLWTPADVAGTSQLLERLDKGVHALTARPGPRSML
jgi:hypothetical protein